MDELTANLLDLLYELDGKDLPLTLGGGLGLYLKQRHLKSTGVQTLFNQLPQPRATNDLDLFIRVEILVNEERTRIIAEAIRDLGYQVVEEAKFFQWKRSFVSAGVEKEVKIDLLVGPLGERRTQVHVRESRVRPKRGSGNDLKFHARTTEEAFGVDEEQVVIPVEGRRSNGEAYRGCIGVPQAFPYLMMKLHAFDDRKTDPAKDLGQHHALDLYSIVGMMTNAEYERAVILGKTHADNPHVRKARQIVRDHFTDANLGVLLPVGGLGLIRLREHKLFRDDFPLGEFSGVLREIFSD